MVMMMSTCCCSTSSLPAGPDYMVVKLGVDKSITPSLTNTQSTTMPGCGYRLIDQGSTATAAPATPWRRHRNPSRYCSPLSPLLISSLMRCPASSFLKPPPVKFGREKETPTYISSDVQAGGWWRWNMDQ